MDVPRLRDFVSLEQVAEGPRPRQRWDATRGLILAAGAVAGLSVCAALAIGPLAAGLQSAAPDPQAIRSAVAAANIVDVHRAWQQLEGRTVDRPPTDDERRLQAIAASTSAIATGLWTLAGIAALVAIVAAASARSGSSQ